MDVLLMCCIIMTEGYGFIILRDCKNVKMNQKSLRIVLVWIVLFLEDILLDVLPIKQIWYQLFVVIYFTDSLTIKSINITINRYTLIESFQWLKSYPVTRVTVTRIMPDDSNRDNLAIHKGRYL